MLSILDISQKLKLLKITDGEELNKIIDQMNASEISDLSKENKNVEEILCSLAKLIPLNNDHFLSKFSSLLNFLLHKQKVVLQDESLICLTKLFIAALQTCGEWVRSDVLVGLSSIVENNADKLEEFLDDLISKDGVIVNLLSPDLHNKTILYHAFQCLYSLLKSPENSIDDDLLEICYLKCLNVLKNHLILSPSDALSLKISISALKCLQHIFTSKTLSVRNFGELLGVLKIFSFYGLPGQNFVTDTNLLPTLKCPDVPVHVESQSESDSPHPKIRKQKKNKRKARKTPQKKQQPQVSPCEGEENPTSSDLNDSLVKAFPFPQKPPRDTKWRSSSSDSELSDAENHVSKIKALQSTIRQNAYLALQAVVKVSNKKIMYGYWSSFLPEHPLMPGIPYSQNVFTTILKDPVPQVRLCALAFLGEILRGSKNFLSHADGRNLRHMSFTSLSSILATMISEIHRCLLLALLAENSFILLTHILKCYTILCENVPYVKLNKDLIFKFLKHVKNHLNHKDIQVQMASFAVFTALINSDVTPPEVESLMLSSDFENAINALNKNLPVTQERQEVPWIVQICKKNIFIDIPLPLKIQYLQLLNSFVGKYFNKSEIFLVTASDIIKYCLDNPDASIELHGAKLLDVIGRCMSAVTDSKLQTLQPIVSKLWESVLKGPLTECLTNESHKSLQSTCCDCLSSLSCNDFESLPMKLRFSYVTILLGLASDQNPIVRGAAIRCLGLYCLFPCLTQDQSFLDDVSVILINSADDPFVNVRFKASWSLGHLSDALFLNEGNLSEGMSSKFFYSIGMACVKYSKDCDRVKANGVRALGNFLNRITEQFIQIPSIQDFINQACEVLVSSLSAHFMKVCWNSCYALRNALQNTHLLQKINLVEVIQALLKVLKSPNFKVRISAAQALTVLTQRSAYGDLYSSIWNHIVTALSTISQDVNFKEIKHQENLGDQLCFSLCQLAALLIPEDVLKITQRTMETRDVLLISMWKFGLHSTEEKNMTVSLALEKLNSLKSDNLTNETETTVLVLYDIFNQAVIGFSEKDNC